MTVKLKQACMSPILKKGAIKRLKNLKY